MRYMNHEIQMVTKNRIFIGMCLLPCFFFMVRFLLPDASFDSLNYHYFLGMKGSQQTFPILPFSEGEFFPLGVHSFNPLLDTLIFKFSEVVGYRFGVLFSLLSLFYVFYGIFKLTNYFHIPITFTTFLLFISMFVVNEAFGQVGSYYLDNIFSAFIICSLLIIFQLLTRIQEKQKIFIQYYALLVGGLLALSMTKLTNIIYVLPLTLICVYVLHTKLKMSVIDNISSYVLFILPFSIFVFPNLYYVYLESANPVFPYYNEIFQSKYYLLANWSITDAPGNASNIGVITFLERILYPYYAMKEPDRLGFFAGAIHNNKIVVLFLSFLIFYLYSLCKKVTFSFQEKVLYFFTFSSYILWQMLFGIARYAIVVELLLACSMLVLFCKHFQKDRYVKLLFVLIGVTIFVQSIFIVNFNIRQNTSESILSNKISSWAEWKEEFQTVDLMSSETRVSEELNNKLKGVDFVLQCVNVTSGYIPTFSALRDKTLLNFDIDWNKEMTSNHSYIKERNNRLKNQYANDSSEVFNFVAITYSDRLGNGIERCNQVLNQNTAISIDSIHSVDNFVGNKKHPLKLVFGKYQIQ